MGGGRIVGAVGMPPKWGTSPVDANPYNGGRGRVRLRARSGEKRARLEKAGEVYLALWVIIARVLFNPCAD